MKKYTGPNGEKRTPVTLDELPDLTPEQLAEIDAIRDEEIDFSDIPYMGDDDEFWENATIGWPPRKVHLTMRLDEDIVNYFKEKGRGYQSRINAVLRSYVEAQRRKAVEAKGQADQPREIQKNETK